ncbi:hypothetical protein K466DRAFT_304960 [Polyporus arcularius HHB13444]|uniref:FAD-binding PCMH-type domain-containing protein n=1 Tax=Polyporus arcularius HHB13444 TaxID=1314778 RepID=A0A5C3NYX9_9APHY|nr:hypothetical protein K466DRAFT_304960 [Polyporus arcularius HHB13444]
MLPSPSGTTVTAPWHGSCPYVGIGGHAGQGGCGIPSHAWGLLVGQVTSLQIVTADGPVRAASKTQNADLFWAATGTASRPSRTSPSTRSRSRIRSGATARRTRVEDCWGGSGLRTIRSGRWMRTWGCSCRSTRGVPRAASVFECSPLPLFPGSPPK